ncbi:patatin-like phospholipase family protein [Calothrix sp. PCC 6303]|uniref:patatin-like phospholipase family protein n=1 Tax=Calothrix sp. PCC 6303 TaxID=1170562 RepID=UPI0002A03AD7|nr:patatin-like phospholipase family protein [Calothrix sp. PCC 6303]AFZ00843.1 Patatin [Calothrix sp. PCC 6303]
MVFRILSLDGGGIRGLVSALMLTEIEKKISQPLNQYFNLVAGTSTGSILAAAIAAGANSQKIVELYKEQSKIIFPYQTRWTTQRIPLLLQYGFSAPKYSDTGLIQVLKATFQEAKLFDINYPLLLIVSYDTIEREPIIFKSWCYEQDYGNVPLWEVCVCSASAPSYFPAHRLIRQVKGKIQDGYTEVIELDENASSANNVYQNMKITITDGVGSSQVRTIKEYVGENRRATVSPGWDKIPNKTSSYTVESIYSAIDGGVAANNPSTCAIAEALKLGHRLEDITVLSIGTGDRTRVIPYEKARSWGLIQWAQPLVGILFDGSSDIFDYVSNQMIHQRHLRLQFKLDRQLIGKPLSDDIDDVSDENINNLIEAARVYMKQPQIQKSLEDFLKIN